MGKTKIKRRSKELALNPVGIPSVKELEEHEFSLEVNLGSADIRSILEKLQGSASDKECAAVTIARMAAKPEFVALIIEMKVIRVAGPLLVDREPAVRHAIAGCLRNLAAYGGIPVCEAMIEQDILTSVVMLLKQYENRWLPSKPIDDVVDSKSEIFLEVCNLLWSLCESSETAVAIFNEKKLVKILLPCLNIVLYGHEIPLVVAQCLNTVSDENPEICADLLAAEVQEQLQTLMTIEPEMPEHFLLKTLAASIMMNTSSGKSHNPTKNLTEAVLRITADALSKSIDPILICLSENITSHKAVLQDRYRDEKDLENKLKDLNKTVDVADCLLKAKQVTLEILTNIYFGDDLSDSVDDISDSDESEIEDIGMDIDETPVTDETTVTPLKLGLGISPDIHSLIKQYGLIQKVIDQITIPVEEVTKITSEYDRSKVIVKSLNTVRSRALLCFNNMLQFLTIEDVGGSTKLFDLWLYIANFLYKQTDFTNIEQLEAATSSVRAVLQKLAAEKCFSLFGKLSESDLQLLMNICHQSQEGAVKVNVIRALGTIGCLIGQSELLQSYHKLIDVIGVFLLEVCSKSTDLWVTAESVDVIIDIFAEDHLDFIAQEINLVEKLQHLHKSFKGKVNQRRNIYGEHCIIIMTAKKNLRRFIQYKINQGRRNNNRYI